MLARSAAGKAFNEGLVFGAERRIPTWPFSPSCSVESPGRFPRNPSTKSTKRRRYATARNSSSGHPELRHQPWDFTSHSPSKYLSFSVSQYNLQLSKYAEAGNVLMTLSVCREMKDLGVKPTLMMYNWIIQAFAAALMPLEARAVVDDMLALGIKPDRTSLHFLLKVRLSWSMNECFLLMDCDRRTNMSL
jgi:pentatricopeptide repeat protein